VGRFVLQLYTACAQTENGIEVGHSTRTLCRLGDAAIRIFVHTTEMGTRPDVDGTAIEIL